MRGGYTILYFRAKFCTSSKYLATYADICEEVLEFILLIRTYPAICFIPSAMN